MRAAKRRSAKANIEVASTDATLAPFAKAAGCGDGRTTTALADKDPKDGTRSYFEKLNGCKAPIELIRVEGGGHTIPGRYHGRDDTGPACRARIRTISMRRM